MASGNIFGMGNWRDQLIPASFRGVEFYVLKTEHTVGRKVRLSTFYGSDQAHIDDMGMATNEYQIEGYVLANDSNGYDYMKQRDLLIDALRVGDPHSDNKVFWTGQRPGMMPGRQGTDLKDGTLCHPFLGEKTVYLKEPAKITESSEEGGIARFQMVFMDTQSSALPADISIDQIGLMNDISLKAFNDFADNFVAMVNLSGQFLNSIGSIVRGVLRTVSKVMSSIQGAVQSSLAAAHSICSTAINFSASILAFPDQIVDVINSGVNSILTTCGMAGEIIQGGIAGGYSGTLRGSVVVLDGTSIPAKLGISAIRTMVNASQVDETTLGVVYPSDQEAIIQNIVDLYKFICLKNAANIYVRTQFRSRDEAQAALDYTTAELDTFLLRLGSYDRDVSMIYDAVEKMREMLIYCAISIMKKLFSLTSYAVPVDGMNSLVFAYNKYQDISRADEVLNMNTAIKHPGFLPGGESLQVLTN